jgi:hypothetical protein
MMLSPVRGGGFMRQLVVLAVCTFATVMSTSFAQATIRITSDRGGRIIDYAERFIRARAAGEQVIIDGTCLSACTLVVGMLPHDKVCATSRAVLGFHAAWRPTARGGRRSSAPATRAMMDVYPANLRDWIDHRGGLTPRMIFLRGRELAAIVPICGSTAGGGTHSTSALRSDSSRAVEAEQPQ